MGAAEVDVPPLPPGFEVDPPLPPGFEVDTPKEVASAPLRGAAAIPGQAPGTVGEAPRAPQKADTRGVLDIIRDEVTGVKQALSSVLYNAPVGLWSLTKGTTKTYRPGPDHATHVAAGTFDPEGRVTSGSEEYMRAKGHTPSSPEAQRNLEAVGDAAEALHLPPVPMSPAGPLAAIAGNLTSTGLKRGVEVAREGARDAGQVVKAVREVPVPGVKQAPAGFTPAPAAAAVAGSSEAAKARVGDLAAKAVAEGIPLNVHHITENKLVKLVGEFAEHVPLSGSKREARQEAFNAGLARAMDPEAKHVKLTPEAFSEMQDKAGSLIGEVSERTPVPVKDFNFEGLARRETPDVKRVIDSYINDLSTVAAENDGVVPGVTLRKLRTEAQTQARRSTAGDVKGALDDLVHRLDDALSKNAAEGDMEILYDARRRYAISKTLEPLVAKNAATGDIPPSALMAAVTNTVDGKRRMARGRGGDLGDYAMIGKQFLSDTKTSNTTERALMFHVLSSVIGAVKAGVAYVPATMYNAFGPRLAKRMIEARVSRKAAAATEAGPKPFNPGTVQGFEDLPPPEGGGGGPGGSVVKPNPNAGPLGDVTPAWDTSPGAGGGGAPPIGRDAEIPAGRTLVDAEAPGQAKIQVAQPDNFPANERRAAGSEIPAVPGRPDLPDTMTVGPPAEAAATARSNAAMVEPGAIEARRQQAPAPVEPPAPVDPRLAGAVKLRDGAKSEVVRKAIDEHIARIEKEIAAENAAAKRAADATALREAARVADDPALRAALQEKAAKLSKEEPIPVGEVKEGQPDINADVPTKPLPVGEATPARLQDLPPEAGITPAVPAAETKELYVDPLRPEAAAWRKEHGLSNEDATTAAKLRKALDADPAAVDKLIADHGDHPTIAFDEALDRLVAMLKPKEKKDAPQAKQIAQGGESAPAGAPATAAEPVKPGPNSVAAAGADAGEAGAGGQAKTLNIAKYEDGWVIENENLFEVGGPYKTKGEAQAARAKMQPKLDDAEQKDIGFPQIDADMAFQRELEKNHDPRTPGKFGPAEQERGVEHVRAKLAETAANGSRGAKASAELAMWMLDQNPNLAKDMHVFLGDYHPKGAKGAYSPIKRIVSLFQREDQNATVLPHEFLHHAEKMMPENVQTGIRREWRRAYEHYMQTPGLDPKVRNALKPIEAMFDVKSEKLASELMERVEKAFSDGTLNAKEHYHLVNPSEFFAVHGSRLLHERFVSRGTWRADAIRWLRGLTSKVVDVLKLEEDHPLLVAIEHLLDPKKTTGEQVSPSNLTGAERNQRQGVQPPKGT